MFIKWLRKQFLFLIVGFGAIYFIEKTGSATGGTIGGPGHYRDGYLFIALLAAGLGLTVAGNFATSKNGSFISGFGLILLIGAGLWVWR